MPTGHEVGTVTTVSGEILASFFMSFYTSKNNLKKFLKSCLETQVQATQEKENAVTKQNMKYTMSSSRGIYLSWLTGRIYSTILADHEKLTIDIKPVKKNMIPVIYYEDITAILMNYKIPGYYIFFICLAVISCFSNPGMIIFVFLFIWAGSNRKITICLRSGNKAIVYARRKKIATAFVEDIKERAKI